MSLIWKLTTVALAVVLLTVAQTDAHRRRRPGRPSRPGAVVDAVSVDTNGTSTGADEDPFNADNVTSFTWTQVLSSGQTVEESVYILPDKNVVKVVVSENKDAEVHSASTIYDFTGSKALTFVKGPGPCFLFNITDLTFDELGSEAATFAQGNVNNSLPHVQVAHNATGEKLSEEERDALFEQYPEFELVCERSGVTVFVDSSDLSEGDTREVKYLTFDEEVTVTVPRRKRGRGFFRWFF